MKVLISTHVRHYTNGAGSVDASGGTLGELMADLERQFPGIRFRVIDEQDGIRKHMNIFINGDRASGVGDALRPTDEVCIFGALSGG